MTRVSTDQSNNDSPSKSDGLLSDNTKSRIEKRDRYVPPPSKVVVRRLPPSMTEQSFIEQVSPLPEHNYLCFVKADLNMGQFAYGRAYINFIHQSDIFIFKEKFDGYVFVDEKGNEYPAVVEFSSFQKVPKKRSRKKDLKCGTIEQDSDYLQFLENLNTPEEATLPSAEIYLEEIEARERELKANNGVLKMSTPLIEFLKLKKIEKQRIKEEKKEERRRRELERKKQKEEERLKRKEAKERHEREGQQDTKEDRVSVVKLLKNPDRDREKREEGTSSETSASKKKYVDQERDRGWKRDEDRRQRDKPREREKLRQERPKDRSRGNDTVRPKRQTESARYERERPKPQPRRLERDHSEKLAEKKAESPPANNAQDEAEKKEISQEVKSTTDTTAPLAKGSDGVDEVKDKEPSKKETCRKNDPRTERRIRNKDRPSMEIYRPGMRRLNSQKKDEGYSSFADKEQENSSCKEHEKTDSVDSKIPEMQRQLSEESKSDSMEENPESLKKSPSVEL